MSDYYINLIPEDITGELPAESQVEQAIAFLLPYTDERLQNSGPSAEYYDHWQFVDCGGELKMICCPKCQAPLPIDWWGEAMGTASEMDFRNLDTELPCCLAEVSLHDLDYQASCGFARFVLVLENPRKELTAEDQVEVERLLGLALRIVRTRI